MALVEEIRPYVAYKGSIALQGVSLTVAAVDREGFEVAQVDHITLDDKKDQVLQVSGGSLSLIDD